jgi:hypothetical protein|tara:strand:- start:263 stop:406 length:144 start_codon:yes stop_codon:yes gene_type:complete
MIGDVWVEKNSKGKPILCIDIGDGKVSKKEIRKNETKVQTKPCKKGL